MFKRRRRRVRAVNDTATLAEHLGELRNRIIICLLALAVGGMGVFLFYNPVLNWLRGPYVAVCATHPEFGCNGKLLITDPLEGFGTRMRVSGYGGLVIALPIILWQLWRFITPGLHPKERRYALPFVLSAVALFLLGAAIAWWTLPKALEFLVAFSGDGTQAFFSPSKYIRLAMLMMVAFGLGFLFPVLLVFLELVGVLTPQQLSRWRRMAIVIIFIAAAVITPSGDPYSLLAMAIPMYVFFEVSILIGWIVQKHRARSARRTATTV